MNQTTKLVVGIITPTYYPNLNGVSIATYRLVEKLREQGHSAFVVTPKVKGVSYPDNILPLPAFPMPKHVSPDMTIPYVRLLQMYRFFAHNHVNVLLSTDPLLTAHLGRLFSKILKIPHIYVFHTHLEAYSYFNFPGYKEFIRSMIRNVCHHADLTVILSHKILRYMKEIKAQAPMVSLINIPHTDHLYPKKKPKKWMDRYGIRKEDFIFITFCRVTKEKGIDTALHILAPLIHEFRNIKYVIGGDGGEIENLRKLSKSLKIENNVIFIGRYDPGIELLEMANLGDCFLFTSMTDNQPISLLEAMSCGLPVLSVDDDSVDYILRHGYNGVKCPKEKLTTYCRKIFLNTAWRDTLSKNARKSSLQLDEASVTHQWISMFQKVVTGHIKKRMKKKYIVSVTNTIKKMLKQFSSLQKTDTSSRKKKPPVSLRQK